MNPIYKFELTVNGTTERAYPLRNDDLSLSFEKESGEEFFRRKLSGELTFQSVDYQRISAAAFDTKFFLEMYISYDAGVNWDVYWAGEFWKTDCKFDEDAQTVKVTPTVSDQYTAILAGLDKEYNLIELKPEITPVMADKRPMIQVYVPGQTVIACFLSGMWWEQECEAISDVAILTETGDGKLNFALNSSAKVVEITGGAGLPDVMVGESFSETEVGTHTITSVGYEFLYYFSSGAGGSTARWEIIRRSDNVTLWSYELINSVPSVSPYTVVLTPVEGSGASGNVTLYIHDIPVYSRYLLDVGNIAGVPTFEISATEDIVPNNRNYHRVVGYAVSDTIYFSMLLSSTPTEWGFYNDSKYYLSPGQNYFPVARRAWGRVSIWFAFSMLDSEFEKAGRLSYTIKDTYSFSSVINVLLGMIAPGVTHYGTEEYSQFLYGANPLTGISQSLFIAPKSNVASAGYDQPAQKAPITLKNITDMLRDCFRCYWFIDGQNRFRIEHISYFMRGGSYSGNPVVGIDLDAETVTRTGKSWSYAANKYEYEKPEMTGRYQFGWMDDVTQPFNGFPIDIISGYVDSSKIENIDIMRFSSDFDYIILNPNSISKDGFVLLSGAKRQRPFYQSGAIQGQQRTTQAVGTPYSRMVGSGSTRITTGLIDIQGAFRVINNSALRYYVFYYDENGNWLGRADTWRTATRDFPNTYGARKIALTLSKTDSSAITPDEIPFNIYVLDDSLILPYYQYGDMTLQNGYLSFVFLQRYYAYDMPAKNYEINGIAQIAVGVKKLKLQSIRFPALHDPDLVKLIKTNIGEGVIDKISVNLSSREVNATLRYDTE